MTRVEPVSLVVGCGLPLVLESLERSLSRRPGLVVVAGERTLAGFVDRVAAKTPDVALVAADIPHWDGLRACAEIKGLLSGTRVVVLGPVDEQSTLLAAVRAGADGYVDLSESVDDLAAAIRAVGQGEARIPAGMLGTLLRTLIQLRREDDEAVERFSSLREREREVLAELVNGLDHQAIGRKLHLSPHTSRTHTQNIFAKLGVHSRLEAATFVRSHDLLERLGIDESERDR